MDTAASTGDGNRDLPWHVIGRLEEYAGEQRANLLRFLGIISFYMIELINRYGLRLGFLQLPPVEGVDEGFHMAVTALALAWTMLGVGVFLCLQNEFFPPALKYISTGCDCILLTSILMIADGPQSPLVVGFFLLISLSALRFNLPLVRFATAGAMLGYLFLCGSARWLTERDISVPRYQQAIMLLALGLTGVIIGQVIRKVRRMAVEYAQRVTDARGAQQ
jgi:hypothetical protein